jgi:hypothetical protein
MMSPTKLEDFEAIELQAEETGIFLRRFGSGPAVLLLHGLPQTHLMWRAVAPLLALRFTVICADLRGYGRNGCPASRPDHAPYAKRAMANDIRHGSSSRLSCAGNSATRAGSSSGRHVLRLQRVGNPRKTTKHRAIHRVHVAHCAK